jgi:hypothetical protein
VSREPIYQALVTLLSALPGFKTVSRRLLAWGQVSLPDQPALFIIQKRENAVVKTGYPTIWHLELDLVIYCNTGGDEKAVPSSVFNPLVDAVVTALIGTNLNQDQTLGGLVTRCRIEGAIETDEGVLGSEAVVIIPITILVPN